AEFLYQPALKFFYVCWIAPMSTFISSKNRTLHPMTRSSGDTDESQEPKLTTNAKIVLKARYLLQNERGQIRCNEKTLIPPKFSNTDER
ncbi:hypothetical protein B6V01_003675, partial [Methanosarcinales archaeon ex4572_44]